MAKKTKAELKEQALQSYLYSLAFRLVRDIRVKTEAFQRLDLNDPTSVTTETTKLLTELKTLIADAQDDFDKLSELLGE